MVKNYNGSDRRKFVRLDFSVPLQCKVCKKSTVSKILQGYTSDISQSGILCQISDKVKKNDLLWLSFDRNTLSICEEMEKKILIYQSGIIGKVIRIGQRKTGGFDVGIQFLTREEINNSHIYPKIHFLVANATA